MPIAGLDPVTVHFLSSFLTLLGVRSKPEIRTPKGDLHPTLLALRLRRKPITNDCLGRGSRVMHPQTVEVLLASFAMGGHRKIWVEKDSTYGQMQDARDYVIAHDSYLFASSYR